MKEIFLNVLAQLIYFVGNVFLIGFLISLVNRLFYRLVKHKKGFCYATGIIGTPIHELSHALLCLVFFHKIEEMKLFQIDNENGVLGYVRHSYRKKNIYQSLGNYFIGIAPIVCGSLILYFSMRYLLPYTYSELTAYLNDLVALQSGGVSFEWISYAYTIAAGTLKALLSEIAVGYPWWIFVLQAACIALHMNMSGADIKSSLLSLPILCVLIIAVNLILGLGFHTAYTRFVNGVNLMGAYLTGMLLLSLIFSFFYLALGLLVRGGISIVGLIRKKTVSPV